MKTYLILPLFITVSLVAGAQDRESQQVLDLHKKKFAWLIARNYDSLNVLLDDKVLYIHSNGLAETKADVMSNLKNEVISYTKSDVIEANARIYGNAAIINGKGTFAGKAKGTPFELNLSYTEVYVRINSKWKLVSRHACKV